MSKIFYVSLESYQARYTAFLTTWNENVFKRRNIQYEVINGQLLSNDQQIVTGSVLDAHGRSYYTLTQTAEIVKMLQQGAMTENDILFFDDMFHPGIESLPYIFNQTSSYYKPKVFVRCLAQTYDPDDFVHRTGMFDWMRKYEEMVDSFVDGILVANEEFAAHLKIAGVKSPIYVTGLPHGKYEILEQFGNEIKPLKDRTKRIVFGSRWDDEKQPNFVMNIAEKLYKIDNTIEIAICTGGSYLKSNNQANIDRLDTIIHNKTANIKVYKNLKKNEYYDIVKDSVIVLNSSLQDWSSNLSGEGDALGCLSLYPAYRSFPEVFANNHNCMYIPWSEDDVVNKIFTMLDDVKKNDLSKYKIGQVSEWNNGTIDRSIDCMLGKGQQWQRNALDYRKHVAQPKF
jgi:hypothetical protein